MLKDRPYEFRRLLVWRALALMALGLVVVVTLMGRLDFLGYWLPACLMAVSFTIASEQKMMGMPNATRLWDKMAIASLVIFCFMLVVLMLEETLPVSVWDALLVWTSVILLVFGIVVIIFHGCITTTQGRGIPSYAFNWHWLAITLMLLVPIFTILSTIFTRGHWVFFIPSVVFLAALAWTDFLMWQRYKNTKEYPDAEDEPLADHDQP